MARCNPMTVSLSGGFEEIQTALDTTYTVSIRGVCKLLKVDRSFVANYIVPYVHHLYISSGYGDAQAKPWTKILSDNYGSIRSQEQVWFDEKELQSYIYSHITSATRQCIAVPAEEFLEKDVDISAFRLQLYSLNSRLAIAKQNRKRSLAKSLREQREALIVSSLNEKGKELYDLRLTSYTGRSGIEAVPVPAPKGIDDEPITDWFAVHDHLGYGDNEETIYRELLRCGATRIELSLPGKNDKTSKKIYYYSNDKWPTEHSRTSLENDSFVYDSALLLTIPYSVWLEQMK